MSEESTKPYLVRALHEWCVDQGYTPHIAVRVNAQTRVPAAYVKGGEIVLNVHPDATHMLTMDNEWILFNARFNGKSQEIAVPFSAVVGIFSKETRYGMEFLPSPEPEPGRSPDSNSITLSAIALEDGIGLIAPAPAASNASDSAASDDGPDAPSPVPPKNKASHLKVVK